MRDDPTSDTGGGHLAQVDLLVVIAAVVGAALAWPVEPLHPWLHHGSVAAGALLSGLAAAPGLAARHRSWLLLVGLAALVALVAVSRPFEPALVLGVLIGAGATWAQAVGWFEPARPRAARAASGLAPRRVIAAVGVGCSLVLAASADVVPGRGLAVGAVLVIGLASLIVRRAGGGSVVGGLLDLVATPARFLVASFASVAAAGTLLLALPVSSATRESVGLLDAAFTAVSATCVTGLIVLDTPNAYSVFGQAVILVLFQVGGLGIMTFAAASAAFAGRRLRVHEEAFAAEMLGGGAVRKHLDRTVRQLVQVTVVTELGGAAVLTALFLLHGDGLVQAAWRGVFTAVSAFCNAGFALQSDSLVPYAGDPVLLLVVSVIIIVGGLGPLAVVALPTLLRGRGTLQTRLVYATTAALLAAPALGWLLLEWNNTLAGMGVVDKVANAWFQAVTLRTAGFNSVDFGAILPATWTLSILCMFVGGSPGSTAGGVKTTTIAVLVLAVVAAVRGREEAEAFRRRLPHRVIYQAAAIATVGVLVAATALVAMQVTQRIPLDRTLFEVVSALATVGLSMGATSDLDGVGKILIMACMFAGRVGPLTLFVVLVERDAGQAARPRPALETVHLG